MAKMKVTKYQVAHRAELNKSTISRIMDGKYNPTLETVERICRALETAPGAMLKPSSRA